MFYSPQQLWKDTLTRNSAALVAVAAQLWALLEAFGGADATRLPRAVYSNILRVLRPAESAVRRLIVMAARDVVVEPVPPRAVSAQRVPKPTASRQTPAKPASRMAFPLFDPRKRFNAQHVTYTTHTPRIYVIAPDAPFSPLSPQPQRLPERSLVPPASTLPASAHRLVLRLKALIAALEDVPRQAKRMLRWRLRREAQVPPRFSAPLRPGNPPGHRERPQQAIDTILAECHSYAQAVLSAPTPNTS
jgi:hypothetical protein